MVDDSSDPAFRKAAAAYRSAGKLRTPPALPHIVRLVEQPSAAPPNAPPVSAPEEAAPVVRLAQPSNASGGVSLMITSAQKDSLRRLGLSEAQIRDMTPAEAHRRLGLSGR